MQMMQHRDHPVVSRKTSPGKQVERVIRVMLIEDEGTDAHLVQHMLSGGHHHFSITRFDRFRSAVESVLASPDGIDVILLGLDNLPHSQGLARLREIHQHCSKLPIIVLSDSRDDRIAAEAVRNGAQDCLVRESIETHLVERSIVCAMERKAAEEALRTREERYALATQGTDDGLWDWDLRKDQLYLSPRGKQMLGFPAESAVCGLRGWFARVHPDDLAVVKGAFRAHLKGETRQLQVEHRTSDEHFGTRWILVRGVSVRLRAGKAYRMAGSFTDITERKRVERELIHNAFHDSLTGLPNRALFLDRVGQTMIQSQRRGPGNRAAVFFLDLDCFKQVNDSLGHSVGDRLLIACARRLESLVRSADTVSRLGGDEFVMLVNDTNGLSDVCRIAERVLERLATPFDIGEHRITTSASIGVVQASPRYQNPEDLLHDADTAMYRAKAKGRGRYEIFDRPAYLEASGVDRQQSAPEGKEFELFFQPVFNLKADCLHSFEAVVRHNRRSQDTSEPGDFPGLTDDTGLLTPTSSWVLAQACPEAASWQKICPGTAVSVRISWQQLNQGDLMEQVTTALGQAGLHPSLLILQLPESATGEDIAERGRRLAPFNSMGVQLLLDNFATGRSSLAQLQQLPYDLLKIDRSLVGALERDASSKEIIRAIISLARSLGMQVVAEGIETEVQLEALRKMGCDLGQGSWFSPPVESSAAFAILHESAWGHSVGF